MYNNKEEMHEALGYCDEDGCTECCEHAEFDHNICLDCGKEFDVLPGYDEDYGQER
jgi:hypothetical protein